MFISYLVDKILEYQDLDLDKTYKRTKYDCHVLLSDDEINSLGNLSPLERQISLKQIVSNKLDGSFENWAADAWIVHTWGGINSFDIDNHARIVRFKDNLNADRTTNLACISSLSKIASFAKPDDYFVYDSRVAFALNGLIIDYLSHHSDRTVLFYPVPSAQGGRDKRMKRFIKDRFPSVPYITETEAYVRFNALVKTLNSELKRKGLDQSPCYVEMLLFELGKTNGEIERILGLRKEHVINTAPNKSSKHKRSSGVTTLSVYEKGSNSGKTLHVKGVSGVEQASAVYVEYKGLRFEAALSTYNSGFNTLRGKSLHRDLILANNWQPGQKLECEFKTEGRAHIFIIK